MGEILDKVTEKLKQNPNNEGTKEKPETTLDKVLTWKEDMTARRYRAAELERMALEAENEARKLRGEPPIHGGVPMDEEKKKEEEAKLREQISTTAVMLLEKGVDPKVVGQYILGSTPVTPITLSSTGMPSPQGLTLADVKEIFAMASERKEPVELKEILNHLTDEVKSLKERTNQPVDWVAFGRQQAEMTKVYYETLKEAGIIKEPESRVTYQGEPLEVVKEKNRHDERMQEIMADREYKQDITRIASEIPERIGRGIAGQFSEEGGSGSGGGKGLEYTICTEKGCGTKIYFTPESKTITCPKCGTVYDRGEGKEGETE